jgi:hypothetical protein
MELWTRLPQFLWQAASHKLGSTINIRFPIFTLGHPGGSQPHDFWIYSYNASDVVADYIKRFFQIMKKKIFWFSKRTRLLIAL